MQLPNFLCIGAQKAGTTVLYDILKQHPDIYLAENKEAHYFSKKANHAKGKEWWINTFFHGYEGQKIMGALTPEYLYYEEIPPMILQELGSEVKIIGIFRHPIDRAYSHYLMSVRNGLEDKPFEEAITLENERIGQSEQFRDGFSYLSRGHYAEQVARYNELFPSENLLWLSYEKDIRENLSETTKRILRFLGLEELELDTNIFSNTAREVRSKKIQQLSSRGPLRNLLRRLMPEGARRKIRKKVKQLNSREMTAGEKKLDPALRDQLFLRYFSDEPEKLKTVTGIDFSYWKPAKP